MAKVDILSLNQYKKYKPSEPSVAIRVMDKMEELGDLGVDGLYKDVLKVNFIDDELTPEQFGLKIPNEHYIDDDDAKQIQNFVLKNKDLHFVVHCHAGVGRSASIGYYILKTLGLEDELLAKRKSNRYLPNLMVYGLLINEPLTHETLDDLLSQTLPLSEVKDDVNADIKF